MCDLLKQFQLVDRINSPSSGSDHSLISWTFQVGDAKRPQKCDQQVYLKNIKECYKRSVPDDFLSSKTESLESVINKLSDGVECQDMIYKIYSKTVLKSEMMEKLDFKVITIKWGMNNKRRRVRKAWWSDTLTEHWNAICEAEKAYLSSSPLQETIS